MSTSINSSILATSTLLPTSNNKKINSFPQKEATTPASSLEPASKVELSEKAKTLASSTLDKAEIGKLLSITTPSAKKEAIKPSSNSLDAYLALNKNKLY